MSNQIIAFNDAVTQQVFLARVNKLAEEMAKEMGVEVNRVGNVSAGSTMITFNIAFKVKTEKDDFQHYKTNQKKTGPITRDEVKMGFKFISKGMLHEITSYRERNWKMPYISTRQDGKLYKWSVDMIVRYCRRYDK